MKSSYGDFKFLLRSLRRWSKTSSHMFPQTMGLSGCLIAVPSDWSYDHRAKFMQWAVLALGFRVGSVGGAGAGVFLRSSDAGGREALQKLQKILAEHKEGKLASSANTGSHSESNGQTTHILASKSCQKDNMSVHSSEGRRTFSRPPLLLTKQPRTSCSPFCDDFVGEILADGMKGVSLNEKKYEKESGYPPARAIKLKPQPLRARSSTLPCFRSSPGDASLDTNCVMPRLSSEGAVNGTDLMNHIHGASPSPLPPPCGRRRSERPSRFILPTRTSLDTVAPSTHCLKPIDLMSPHPRPCTFSDQTPLRFDVGLETPMPKQVEHWGSRPINGKDWGDSHACGTSTISSCNQIFALSWFSSEFYHDQDLRNQYQLSLTEDDEKLLLPYANCDSNITLPKSNLGRTDGDCREELTPSLKKMASPHFPLVRADSVSGSSLARLDLNDDGSVQDLMPYYVSRRRKKLAKLARMSLCAAASNAVQPHIFLSMRKRETSKIIYHTSSLSPKHISFSSSPTKRRSNSSKKFQFETVMSTTAFSHILSFLNEAELIHSASLVSAVWADAATEALGVLMLISIGCDPTLMTKGNECDDSSADDECDSLDLIPDSSETLTIAESMKKDWSYLMSRFPWARFLSDGAFKRVYRVWNDHCRAYEALSVMNLDTLNTSGNLNLVGAELAVSVLLSSLARRNICPNFVITRGIFTCRHEPPAVYWGCRESQAPRGEAYDGKMRRRTCRPPKPGQRGNYQYIRMELCQHGDIEEYIRKLPDKMFQPHVCRNLLFQMAFALHVAGDRFGMKHYDVKLLNFFLQSTKESSILDQNHPHVVLRYGVGAHIFRVRMHPSTAFIVKLADYGTSVLRADTDGQPISLGQFTTIENTPPDFLILGNSAEQGYGHDCFGLGLCMLHLFTGHAPYEEILQEVVCPKNLRNKLRKIWKLKQYGVVWSIMVDDIGQDGNETEDETLYNTLYRFLVLFGIPESHFSSKEHSEIWRAINSSLLPPPKSHHSAERIGTLRDADVYYEDRKKYSLSEGNDERIANARRRLEAMEGGMEILLSLVSFDPKQRATPLDVINSRFMAPLIEEPDVVYCESDIVKSFTAYLAR